jgi:uncharacterized protein
VQYPSLVIEHVADDNGPARGPWLAQVRAPEGLTVIREASAEEAANRWTGLYADDPHGLDVPGMLASVISPLAAARLPVFVASTYHADLVLVPADRLTDAAAVLRDAGHDVATG